MKRILGNSLLLPLWVTLSCTTGNGGGSGAGPNGDNGGNNAGTGSTSSNNAGAGNNFNVGNSGGTAGNSTSLADLDSGCGSDVVPAELTRVNILFLLDKSGSMGDDPLGQWTNAATRWNPVVNTLRAFFQDPNSSRLYASLSFLPADGDITNACKVANYSSGAASLKVPLTLLDAAGRQLFLSKLCDPALTPPAAGCIVPQGGTPTRPALQGTIDYAANITLKNAGSKTVIVFLTDGEPGYGAPDSTGKVQLFYSCDDLNTAACLAAPGTYPPCISHDTEVARVAAVIQSAQPAKSIYVVGVGSAVDFHLDTFSAWATASGNPAISLLDMSGDQAAATLKAALEAIRTTSISCNFKMPTPTGSGALNINKVNFKYVDGTGKPKDVGRTHDGTSATCNTSSLGWYFDNPTAPTEMNLCPSTCTALQQDPNGQIQVVFGCSTQIF